MQEQAPANDVKIFIPDANSKKGLRLFGLKGKTFILAAIILIAIIGGVLVFRPQPAFNQKEFNIKVGNYESSGNYDGLINYVNGLPKNQSTYSALIIAYTYKHDYTTALNIYKVVISKYGNNVNTASGAASVAESAHQYSLALTYYRDALQYEKEKSPYPTKLADEQVYENQIQKLEAL